MDSAHDDRGSALSTAEPVSASAPARRALLARYWRWSVYWTLLGLAAWGVLTFAVVWFARDLDRFTVAHVPAGYWWAAQGAIGGFLVIIVVYCLAMEWLEERVRERDPAPPAAAGTTAHD